MTLQTTVVLVDDHPVFRKGLRMLLEDETDLSVIGEAGDGEQAITLINQLKPDVAVLDISMPGLSGIEVAERISNDSPGTRVVALSIHSEKRFVEEMIVAGAAGYILKQSAPEDLVNGVRTVINGEAFLSPSITSVVLSGFKTARGAERLPGPNTPQIIGGKLYPVKLPEKYVKRLRLFDRLEKGCRLPMTLITAPAGYGKSTFVSSWLQQQPMAYAWISLDETDNDLRQFIHYFIHALQKLSPGSFVGSEKLINATKLPPIHTLAVKVLQEIEGVDQDFILALDDVHLVHDKRVYDFLSELLRHPPQQLHFIIMGRRDPFLPIGSLRGKRMLKELRSKELQFSLEETRQYLQLLLGETLREGLAELLHRKMEGWIGGLRLALLSSDQEGTLGDRFESFTGDSLYVQEYLFNEVLDDLAPALRSEVMKLAVLDRFCGPLCEVMLRTGEVDANRSISGWNFLRELKQANLFLVSLDPENIWYRFHPLFQQLLLKQLQRSSGTLVFDGLHRAAGDWFLINGFIEEGIKHAILGNDLDRAEDVVQQFRHEELGRDRWNIVEQWLSMFPEEAKLSRPSLLLAHAWVCHDRYRLQEVAVLVERLDSVTIVPPLEGPLLGEFQFLKGVLSYWDGNSKECLQRLTAARDLLPESSHLILGMLETYEALAQQMDGNLLLAIEQLNAKSRVASIKPVIFRSRLIASLSFVHFIGGDLHQASEAAERLRILSAQNELPYTETWGQYMLANTSLQLFDLERAARTFLSLADKLHTMHTRAAIDALAGLALTRYYQQEPQEAFAVTDRLHAFTLETQDQFLVSVARSLKARLLLMEKDEGGAKKCLQLMGPQNAYPILFTWLELPEMTRLRVLISIGSDGNLDLAKGLLVALKRQAVSAHNICHLVDILVLETLLLVKTEGVDEAQPQLEEAVALAARGGWIRPFMEGGRPLKELLNRLKPATDMVKRHIRAILNSGTGEQVKPTVHEDQSAPVLEEPLTSREFEILVLLAQRLRNKEIGDTLFISPETVKSHIKRLFSKLDAVDRRDVVDKATVLGLLEKK